MSRKSHSKKKSGKFILFLIYVLLAIYLINFSFNFIRFPNFFSAIHNWILLISGIFLALGAFKILTTRRRH